AVANAERRSRTYARGKQAFAVACGDFLGDVGRKLAQPAAVIVEDLAVARPALVDPRIGAHNKAIGPREEQRPPCRGQAGSICNIVSIGQLADQPRITLEILRDLRGRGREAAVRPDDAHAWVMPKQDFERRVVAVRVQPQPAAHRERDDLLSPWRAGVAAEDVKFADSPPVDIALELALDQRKDRG